MGRHPTGKVPFQPLRIISDRHRDIMRRLIVGETQHNIARDIGMTESRLSIICNSPLFKRELEKLRTTVKEKFIDHTAETAKKIDELQPEAVKVLELIVKQNKDANNFPIPLRLKKDTALDILELAGSGKRKTKEDDAETFVKLISEGFKLATELREGGGNGNGNGNGNGDNNHKELNITPDPKTIENVEYTVSDANT